MAVIADSSALIVMVKIARLDLLKKLYKRVIVPPSVYQEVVVEGKRLRKPGVERIEKAIQEGWIEVVTLTINQQKNVEIYRPGGIGKGEAEAIALAKSRQYLLLLDDRCAREIAGTLGLEFSGTAAVLLEAYLNELLTKKEFMESLRDLGKVMWLSPDVIAEIVRIAEEMGR